jgi:intracellular septation protein
VLGAVNLAVAFLLSEAMWINFKVWGNLILTFLFVFAQMPYLSRYIEVPEKEPTDPGSR